MPHTLLKAKDLKAALICAAKNDVRYYLNAVLVEVRARDTLIVSTDGHRLAVIRTHIVPEGEPDQVPAQVIIPRDSLKGLKAARGIVQVPLEYPNDPEKPLAPCTLSCLAEDSRVFVPVDARYPDWRRVVPDKVTGELAKDTAFDPYFVADFVDVVRAIADNRRVYITVAPNGQGAALAGCSATPDFIGVLMPMRNTGDEVTRPDWL